MDAPILDIRDVSLSFRGVKALSELSFSVARHEVCALIRTEWGWEELNLDHHQRRLPGEFGRDHLRRRAVQRPTPMSAAPRGVGRTFQNNALFHRMGVIDNVLIFQLIQQLNRTKA